MNLITKCKKVISLARISNFNQFNLIFNINYISDPSSDKYFTNQSLNKSSLTNSIVYFSKKELVNEFVRALPNVYIRLLEQCSNGFLFYNSSIDHIFRLVEESSKTIKRILICGPKGSGKSMALFSVIKQFKDRGWIIIHIPSLFNFITNSSRVVDFEEEGNHFLDQPDESIKWLTYFKAMNSNILNERIVEPCLFGVDRIIQFSVKKNDLIRDAIDQALAKVSFTTMAAKYIIQQVFKINDRPPILLAIDGINAFLCRSSIYHKGNIILDTNKFLLIKIFYDFVFSNKYEHLFSNKDVILGSFANRELKSVKQFQEKDYLNMCNNNLQMFRSIFRPQAVNFNPTFRLNEVVSSNNYQYSKSYRVSKIDGVISERDLLKSFNLPKIEQKSYLDLPLQALYNEVKSGFATIQIDRKDYLEISFHHLDLVLKSSLNMCGKSHVHDAAINRLFGVSHKTFKTVVLHHWTKDQVRLICSFLFSRIIGKESIDEKTLEEIYLLSSYGNPLLVINLVRKLFDRK